MTTLKPKPDPIYDATIGTQKVLNDKLSIKGRDLEHQLTRAGKKLPRKVRAAAQTVLEAKRRAQHLPYVPESEIAKVRKAQTTVSRYADAQTQPSKKDKKAARLQWFYGLALNYALFLVALVAFWYIANHL